MSFNDLFYKWFEQNEHTWSDNHAKKVMNQCRRHLLKHIGNKSIDDITTQDILWVFKKIESLGVIETLEKVRGYTGRVFRFAVGLGLLNNDPTRDLSGADPHARKILKQKILGVDIFGHNPKGADLTNADLRHSNITKANLTGAVLCNTKTPWGVDNSSCY